ncbi:hypothetical protein [Clostridium sp.]|uniref:hypothetical protein n=1 Tax=Clostridium sp. TaxID=1506 RepID=UPI00399552E0
MRIQYEMKLSEYKSELSKFNKPTKLSYLLSKNFNYSNNTTSNVIIQLSNDELQIYENDDFMKISLDTIVKLECNEKYIYILNNLNYSVIIPFKAFLNDYERENFIDIINSKLSSEKKYINIDKETLIFSYKKFYIFFCILIPIIIASINILIFSKNLNILDLIVSSFTIASIISLFYHLIIIKLLNTKLHIKKSTEEKVSFKFQNNEIDLCTSGFVANIKINNITKISSLKRNTCFHMNKNIVINSIFISKNMIKEIFSLKEFFTNIKTVNKNIKVKKYKIFTIYPSYLILFLTGIFIVILPVVIKLICILIALIILYITSFIYYISNHI